MLCLWSGGCADASWSPPASHVLGACLPAVTSFRCTGGIAGPRTQLQSLPPAVNKTDHDALPGLFLQHLGGVGRQGRWRSR